MSHTIKLTQKAAEVRVKHIRDRLSLIANKAASDCLGLSYEIASGKTASYSITDMRYDLNKGYIE